MKPLIVIATMFFSMTFLHAQQLVSMQVDGMSCPFCAYGLEKKMLQLDGVENLKIDIEKGMVTFQVQEGKTVTDDQLRKVVKDAGFTPKEIKRSEQKSTPKKEQNE